MKFSTAIFKTFFLSLAIIGQVNFLHAQTASILPNAKTTFVDQNGKPLTSGTIDFYSPGTTTRKTTWQDSGKSVANTNPVILDAAGRALIWGDGAYRQVVKDRNGNLIWDQNTSSIGTGGSSGTTVGDGLPVGTILPWSGLIPPNNYQLSYGQSLSRSTYSALYQALTIQTSVSCVGGSPVINVTDTSNLAVGGVLESICISGSPTILSKTSSTVTMSANSTITISTTGVFYPYGNGDGLTSFNLPDLRGYVVAGRCNMGGVDCSNLNSTYFSSNANNTPSSMNAKGGNQSKTLSLGQLPTGIQVTGNITVTSSGIADIPRINNGSSVLQDATTTSTTPNARVFPGQTAQGAAITSTGNNTLTSSNTLGQAFSIIQPTLTLNYIIKVTPDANLTSSFGVASIGGMAGIIACGTNVTCVGNTINFALSATSPAATIRGNPTSSTITTSDFTIQGLTNLASPSATLDFIPIYDHLTNTIKNVTPSVLSAGSAVASLNGQIGSIVLWGPPQGRLTLASNTPVMSTSQAAKTTMFYTSTAAGKNVPIYNGTSVAVYQICSANTVGACELSVPLGTTWQAGSNYDWFIGLNPTPTLCAGPDWSAGAVPGSNGVGTSTRGTGAGSTELENFDGLLTNKNSMACYYNNTTSFTCAPHQCTYLGSTRTGLAGQISFTYGATGAAANLYVWNAYNKATICTTVSDSVGSWTYSSATIRQANNTNANQINFMTGAAADSISASNETLIRPASSVGAVGYIGIALNSTTVFDKKKQLINNSTNTFNLPAIVSNTYPGQLGANYVSANEQGDGSTITTYFGDPYMVLKACMSM